MDFTLLQTFVHVAKQGGFRKAAEKQFLTPSAVSSRIKLLEDQLGVLLFERGKSGARLTLPGKRLMEHAEDMLSTWNRVRQDMILPEKANDKLAIGATDTIWQICMVQALATLVKQEKHLALRLETGMSESLVYDLLQGTLDAVCLFDLPDSPLLQADVVGEITMVLVSTQALSLSQVGESEDYLHVDWGRALLMDDVLQKSAIGAMVSTSIGWLGSQWLREHGGHAYLPKSLVQDELKEGRLFSVPDAAELVRPVYLVYPRSVGDMHSKHAGFIQQLITILKGQ